MSAEENIQIAQNCYAAFGRGDIAGILDAVDGVGHPGHWPPSRRRLSRKSRSGPVFPAGRRDLGVPGLRAETIHRLRRPGRGAGFVCLHVPQHRPFRVVRVGDGLDDPERKGCPLPGIRRHRSTTIRPGPIRRRVASGAAGLRLPAKLPDGILGTTVPKDLLQANSLAIFKGTIVPFLPGQAGHLPPRPSAAPSAAAETQSRPE
jgi:hypothetical protein